jgi:hypothetical protein
MSFGWSSINFSLSQEGGTFPFLYELLTAVRKPIQCGFMTGTKRKRKQEWTELQRLLLHGFPSAPEIESQTSDFQSPCANHQTTLSDKKNVRLCHTSFISSSFWKWPWISELLARVWGFSEDGKGRTKRKGFFFFSGISLYSAREVKERKAHDRSLMS